MRSSWVACAGGPPPWSFSLLILPLGMYVGFIWTALPFLLSWAGVPVEEIARIGAAVVLWLIDRLSLPLVGLATAPLVALPAYVALTIAELPRSVHMSRQSCRGNNPVHLE